MTNKRLRTTGVDGEKCRKSRGSNKMHPAISIHLGYLTELKLNFVVGDGGGGGGFTRPIPRDGGADQFRGIPIVGRLPTDGTRGPEEKGCGRKWPDAEGLVQGSRARDVRDPVIQNHSCCKKESRLDQPCVDKS